MPSRVKETTSRSLCDLLNVVLPQHGFEIKEVLKSYLNLNEPKCQLKRMEDEYSEPRRNNIFYHEDTRILRFYDNNGNLKFKLDFTNLEDLHKSAKKENGEEYKLTKKQKKSLSILQNNLLSNRFNDFSFEDFKDDMQEEESLLKSVGDYTTKVLHSRHKFAKSFIDKFNNVFPVDSHLLSREDLEQMQSDLIKVTLEYVDDLSSRQHISSVNEVYKKVVRFTGKRDGSDDGSLLPNQHPTFKLFKQNFQNGPNGLIEFYKSVENMTKGKVKLNSHNKSLLKILDSDDFGNMPDKIQNIVTKDNFFNKEADRKGVSRVTVSLKTIQRTHDRGMDKVGNILEIGNIRPLLGHGFSFLNSLRKEFLSFQESQNQPPDPHPNPNPNEKEVAPNWTDRVNKNDRVGLLQI